jgi:hypothetical protein
MKGIAVIPGTKTAHLVDRPALFVKAPDEVKVKVLQVGICGTDREETGGGRCLAPEGRQDLIIGHEMFGRVVEAGPSVSRVKLGDYAVFTVRRGCSRCLPCSMNRPDMCRTGRYRERGIWGLDGYQTEFVVDKEQYVVRVPAELKSVGVLCEPLSVAEKAIDEVVRLQTARLPDALSRPDWLFGRRCLVAGMGPIGLLAALAFRLRGAEVYGLDIDVKGFWPMVRKAASFLVINGPVTQQDRWEEDPGYSPFTLAAEITGLLAAADLAELNDEATAALYLREIADAESRAITCAWHPSRKPRRLPRNMVSCRSRTSRPVKARSPRSRSSAPMCSPWCASDYGRPTIHASTTPLRSSTLC